MFVQRILLGVLAVALVAPAVVGLAATVVGGPILGIAVAAVVNASFQTDVARAARYGYRQRWLMARRLLPSAEAAG